MYIRKCARRNRVEVNRRRHRQNPIPKQRMYCRHTDCWNCGSRNHMKNQCPLPSSLKCSHCQRPNVRSDLCECQHKKRTASRNEFNRQLTRTKVETSIFVEICGKTIRALFNPTSQETFIGQDVANLILENSNVRIRKIIIREEGNLSLVSCVKMNMHTRRFQEVTTDGIINNKLAGKIIVLGMRAIHEFGFKFYIGGQEAKTSHREYVLKFRGNSRSTRRMLHPRRRTSHSRNESTHRGHQDRGSNSQEEQDDDLLSFLDEDEARRIRDWN